MQKKKKQEVKRKPEKMFELKFFFYNYLRRMFNCDDLLYIHLFILRFKYMKFIYLSFQNLISLFTDHPLYFSLQSL